VGVWASRGVQQCRTNVEEDVYQRQEARTGALVKTNPAILFLDQSGELGGAELCLADLAEFCRERCAVLLFQDGPFAELLRAKSIPVIVATLPETAGGVGKAAGAYAYLRAIPGVALLIYRAMRSARDFELLYANTAKALVVAAVVAFLLRKRFFFHLHDIVNADHFSSINRRLIVVLANRAQVVVANSQASAESYKSAGGKNRRVTVIHNGFKPSLFLPGSSNSSARTRCGIPEGNSPIVGLFGRITPWKGQHIFLKALEELPDVRGLIVGEALFTGEDRRYRQELRELAAQLGIADRVHFTGFCSDIVPFLLSVDIVAHCLTSPEPFGRVIVEAMLAGRPVIATRGGGATEIVTDNNTGLLVEPGDPHSLAAAIQRLIEDRDFAAKMGRAAIRDAEERFGLDRILRQWERCIEEVTGTSTLCA
jgi:glycosyltransferase involved in cell wall biosynthesis